MAFTAYATVPETKAWITLSDTIDDVVITDILDAVTAWIDEHCQRHFWQDGTVSVPVARTFQACSQSLVELGPFNDLTAAVAPTVATDDTGDGTFETSWAATDFQLLPFLRPTGRPYREIETIGNRLFPLAYGTGRLDRVQVTGVWGWAAVPEGVKQACLIQASRLLKRRYSPEGVAGFSDFGAVRVPRLDHDVIELLSPYRLTPVLVA